MAMVINNNSSAQMALGEMRKNNNKLEKASQQAATGVKIGGAGDGASEYSISEKMRVQIRGLEQDIANAQTGTSLIKTAEGGIQDIIDNLRSLKELALNAANDHNTDLDRETIQKEVNSRLETIDDIASTTNYNGRLLLNGDYGVKKSQEPKGIARLIAGGTYDYNITKDGVYAIDSNYHGHINITASNVKLIPQTAGANLTAIAIKTSANGGANLWLDGIDINNASTAASDDLFRNGLCNVIQFQGSGNTLNIKNEVKLVAGNYGQANQRNREASAVINMGDGLTINGYGDNSSLTANLNDTGSGRDCYAAAIGTNTYQSTTGSLTIKNLNTISTYCEFGTNIGAGAGGSIGSITIDNVDWLKVRSRAAGVCIGAHTQSSCGSIDISADIIYGSSWGSDSNGAIIRGNSVSIGTRYMLLANKAVTAKVGSNFPGSSGNGLTIDAASAVSNGRPYVSTAVSYSPYPNSQVYEVDAPNYKTSPKEDSSPPLNDLIIHTGTKANQRLLVVINSMDTDSLGIQPLPVNPRDAAVSAISAIDNAIGYSLNENTRMGAYQTELSYTIANLTTASENTQASESTIRDADMAKTMMEHAKYTILTQSAQSMLAQSNQNSSSVLSLLQ